MGRKHSANRRAKRLSILVTLALVGAVAYQELQKPKEERDWHGRLAGCIPYDLRPPTLGRIRDAMWAPENPKIFTPRAFGIGWDINFGRLCSLLKGRSS